MPANCLYYWDANLFLNYLNNEPEKVLILEAILDKISKSDTEKIVTSVLSKVEVAWAATEKFNRCLNKDEEAKIDSLWNDSSIIELVDFNDEISYLARTLLRNAMSRGFKLRTNDAIHLASAQWVGAYEFNTYDSRLYKFDEFIGMVIKAPIADQPKLF